MQDFHEVRGAADVRLALKTAWQIELPEKVLAILRKTGWAVV